MLQASVGQCFDDKVEDPILESWFLAAFDLLRARTPPVPSRMSASIFDKRRIFLGLENRHSGQNLSLLLDQNE